MSDQELIVTDVQAIGFEGQNRPGNVNDNKPETRWSYQKALDPGNPEETWIILDLGEEKDGVKSVGIHWYNPPSQMGRKNTFEVKASSDNANYAIVMPRHQSEGKNEIEIYEFDNEARARYIKIKGYGNSSNSWVSINTIKVNPQTISIDHDNTSTSTSDRFGVKKIYPTKTGTQEFYMPNVNDIATNEVTKQDGSKVYDNGIYHQRRNRIRNLSGMKTRSNDMHFKKSMLDQEVTGYFKFINGMADVDVKLRGGHHSDGSNESARCYIFTVKKTAFQKEHPHNGGFSYAMHDLQTRSRKPDRDYLPEEKVKFQMDFNSLRNSGRWVGFKGITINEAPDKVRCEMYFDTEGIDTNGNFEPNRQNWRLYYSIIDEDGKYGIYADGSNGKKNRTRSAWTTAQVNSTVQFRLDAKRGNTSMTLRNGDFKFLSAREIVRPSS